MINLKQMYLCPIGGQLLHQRETSCLTFLTSAHFSAALFCSILERSGQCKCWPRITPVLETLRGEFFVWAVQCPMCPPNWNCKCAFRSQELALPVAAPPPESRWTLCWGELCFTDRRMLIGYDDPISNKPGLECYCPPPSWSRFAELHHRFTPGLTRCLLSRVKVSMGGNVNFAQMKNARSEEIRYWLIWGKW